MSSTARGWETRMHSLVGQLQRLLRWTMRTVRRTLEAIMRSAGAASRAIQTLWGPAPAVVLEPPVTPTETSHATPLAEVAPDEVDWLALVAAAERRALAGEVRGGIAELESLVAERPDLAEAHCALGTAYKRAGRTEDAESHLLTALRLDPDLLPAWNNLGNLRYERADLEGAMEAYRRAAHPGFADPWIGMSKVQEARGRRKEAIEFARRATAAAPGDSLAWATLAEAASGQDPELVLFAVEHNPDPDADLLAMAASAAWDLGRKGLARSMAERAWTLDEGHPVAGLVMARCSAEEDPDAALARLGETRYSPATAQDAAVTRARAWASKGERARAFEALDGVSSAEAHLLRLELALIEPSRRQQGGTDMWTDALVLGAGGSNVWELSPWEAPRLDRPDLPGPRFGRLGPPATGLRVEPGTPIADLVAAWSAVPGIGPLRARVLAANGFRSLAEVRRAGIRGLRSLPGCDARMVLSLWEAVESLPPEDRTSILRRPPPSPPPAEPIGPSLREAFDPAAASEPETGAEPCLTFAYDGWEPAHDTEGWAMVEPELAATPFLLLPADPPAPPQPEETLSSPHHLLRPR